MLLPHNKVSGGVQDSQIMIPSFFDRFYVMPPLTNGVHYKIDSSVFCKDVEYAFASFSADVRFLIEHSVECFETDASLICQCLIICFFHFRTPFLSVIIPKNRKKTRPLPLILRKRSDKFCQRSCLLRPARRLGMREYLASKLSSEMRNCPAERRNKRHRM